MKRKASITALDDLYNTILKSSLLDSLDVKKSKSDPIAQLLGKDEDEDDGDDDDSKADVEKSDKTPKIIEFSVTRMGKSPSRDYKDVKDMKKSLGGQFGEKEAQTYFKKKKKRR